MGRKKKIAALCGGIAVAAVLGYAAYVLLTYHRIPDGKETGIEKKAENHVLKEEQSYTISSYNIGFGAYTPEFTFFMDGGKQSVAESPESVVACVKGAGEEIAEISPDFALLQEVDLNSTRSHHINEYGMLKEIFSAQDTTFAVNYDSVYLMVPPWEPHGKSLSGMAVFSSYPIESAIRRSLPIQEGFKKLLDLDRCYQVVKIPVENGKYLCLYHVH
ncbi:endonuclease/exonuclease/phosphatase family protein, partial [Anaerotignum sp.]